MASATTPRESRDARRTTVVFSGTCVFGCLERFADLFHPPAIDPHVGIPDARRRAEVNRFRLVVEQELRIINEAEDTRAKLDTDRALPGIDDDGAGNCTQDREKAPHGLPLRRGVAKGCDGML